MDYGLIGKNLSHSYSKLIHGLIGDYDYEIQNLAQNELGDFLKKADFKGINVTIPYKKAVMPFCHTLSPTAKKLGNVNTLVKDEKGRLHGHNTDYLGLAYMVEKAGLELEGREVLILGSGGAGLTARALAEDRGAAGVSTVSRSGPLNYENVYELCKGANVIINASPVGMYPNTGESPLDLAAFTKAEAVLDLIYNPIYTRLLSSARQLGIKNANGLTMLAAQAMQAAELFFDGRLEAQNSIDQIVEKLTYKTANIVLVGMPGSGKSTVGRALAALSGKTFVDTDKLIEKEKGRSTFDILSSKGQAYFRDLEAEILARVAKENSQIIASGGGAVLRPENRDNLRQNAFVVFLDRALDELATEGRPLSADPEKLRAMYVTRLPIYKAVSDKIVLNDKGPKEAAAHILDLFEAYKF
ncbi:MAG: hypothetical protein GX345_06735 [Clostridiales bacterium]|nr:hypothetical protein [Clostridiales bacterium]